MSYTKGPLCPAEVIPEDSDEVRDHFREVTKMIDLGKGEIGCYDIVALHEMQIIGRAYASYPPGIILPAEANARLWAASGDLLEACKAALVRQNLPDTPAFDSLRAQLRAAIAKATGEALG